MLEGAIEFPGLTDIAMGAEMIFSRGPSPSSCLIRTHVEPLIQTAIGLLEFKDISTGKSVKFPNACVNRATLRLENGTAGPRWSVQVYDRRWAWASGSIEGEYNQRRGDGSLVLVTRRNMQELAALLLDAMGEVNYDVSVLPVNTYPPAIWKCANPALTLEALANLCGCTIVLGLDNRVRIVQVGVGAVLPDDNDDMVYFPYNLIPSRRPNHIHICMGDIRWQLKWELEPVGCEADGTLKPINDLSYIPAGGWGNQWWCEFADVDPASKPLAHKYIWKWWRIKQLAEGGLRPLGCPFDVTSIEQYLPLEPRLLKHATTPLGAYQQEPVVEGQFWTQGDMSTSSDPFTLHSGQYRLLGELGVVEFEYPVLYLAGGTVGTASLYLTASCRIRQENGKEHASYGYELALGGDGSALVVRHPELFLAVVHTYDGANRTGFTSSKTAIDAEASVYTTQLAKPYQDTQFQDMTYTGIIEQPLDGAVAQIQWRVGMQHGCETRISRMQEFSPLAKDAVQRGRKEKVDAI